MKRTQLIIEQIELGIAWQRVRIEGKWSISSENLLTVMVVLRLKQPQKQHGSLTENENKKCVRTNNINHCAILPNKLVILEPKKKKLITLVHWTRYPASQ